ncbi:MAG: hypothetical protein BalsKO_11290 [Balneolaceae bacterium]
MSCDSSVSPVDKLENAPTVQRLNLSPQQIIFNPSDGFKDTTLSISIEASIENVDEGIVPGFVIRDKSSSALIVDGELSPESRANIFRTELNLITTTTSFDEYIVEVFAYNNDGNGNFYQTTLKIEGFSNDPPTLLEVNNPEEVIIPSEGEIVIPFTAKVFDPDGQDNIDRVLIEFINEDGSSLIPTSNQLFDNGLNEDVAPGDSIYTIAFRINSSNTPNNRKAIYFAIDKAGLYSDTLETVFNIVEQ